MYNHDQLATLAAICDSGSFEGAATALHISSSAVSQRITALERASGAALLQRTRPVLPTRNGQALLRLARQIEVLTVDADAELRGGSTTTNTAAPLRFSLAINADSVSTWFQPVMKAIAVDRRILLDLHIEDQDHTDALLRQGAVMAAVTTSRTAAPGCTVEPLGAMVYWPACAPSLIRDADSDGCDPSRLPMLRFDKKDDLQHAYLRKIKAHREPPIHYLPSNREFLTAARLGLGWGVLPEGQIARDLADGTLVHLDPDHNVTIPLYWQRWHLPSETLDRITGWVRDAAHNALIDTPKERKTANRPPGHAVTGAATPEPA
ncbi:MULTISPECIES: LysR family transcriptional regulator ArgP [Nocardiaceae]|uniref:AttR protein n=2 Tax=Rhodococcoides fascians TaxID=1828 RepID=Q93JR1_RHOFA|nr:MULTISPECIES: LysR family transcriptional regulator ArgP [Rhodococcus]AET25200.1 LysR type transcriptional regulator [Rhodococcus fascians D188]AMY56227.1 putative HTH-type transcriptional regulator [Rhodococcus fascians D188]OZC43738.1 transcriptional regulator ArgP [Rhodococcus sp. RS1C4]OZC51357.1 transcriptional regulator ArgP [Rhodococcus sp. 06-621-2]OZC60776.1 transcriptional regulator ArgP [Rhodococcus sp. 06-469-3-2]